MSEENVEKVRQALEEFRAGFDRRDPSAFFDMEFVDDDYEWVVAQAFEGREVWTGRDEFVEFFRRWTEQFDAWSFQIVRLIDADDDRVVVLLHQSATGKESGVPVEWEMGQVYELEEGRMVRVTNHLSHAEALEAAGLEG